MRQGRGWQRFNEPAAVLLLLLVMTVVATLTLGVNPWPRDGWFESRELLFARQPGADNYVPVTVPALLFKCCQLLAAMLGLDLRGEMYLDSIAHNLLLLLSAVFLYFGLRTAGLRSVAGLAAVLFLAMLQATGLAQAMWSENTAVFLFAAVLYLYLRLYSGGDARFWSRTAWCAVLAGLLIITRVTPALLLPAGVLLLWGRVDGVRLTGHVLMVTGTTVLLALMLMWSNELRFGRFELTNSSGRHLWQGVTYLDEASLESSPTLRELRALNPVLRGQNWWEVRLPAGVTFTNGGDELLGHAARDAILGDLRGYLWLGLEKFGVDLFVPPYRLGDAPRFNHPDPLGTDVPLPPLAGQGPVSRFLAAANARAYDLGALLFPVAIFLVLTAGACELLQRASSRPLRALAQLLIAASLIVLMSLSRTPVLGPAVALLCAMVLLPQLGVLALSDEKPGGRAAPLPHIDGRLYLFLIAMYFGSLWFSWQVEMSNTRNVLPYLPFLAAAAGCAITHWGSAVCRLRGSFRDAAY